MSLLSWMLASLWASRSSSACWVASPSLASMASMSRAEISLVLRMYWAMRRLRSRSGKIQRHRLNRGGDRRANATLFRIIIVRLRWHQPTRDYMARRLAEGKTKLEIIRCLKRFLARELFHAIRQAQDQKDLEPAT